MRDKQERMSSSWESLGEFLDNLLGVCKYSSKEKESSERSDLSSSHRGRKGETSRRGRVRVTHERELRQRRGRRVIRIESDEEDREDGLTWVLCRDRHGELEGWREGEGGVGGRRSGNRAHASFQDGFDRMGVLWKKIFAGSFLCSI